MKTFTVLSCFRCSPSPAALPPTDVAVVQEGVAAINVSWTPPSPLGDTTGYRIHYTNGGGSSGSQTVDGGSTNTYLLTDLLRQATYTLSITVTSEHLRSTTLTVRDPIKLGELSERVIVADIYPSVL